tara:strand:- start:13525 stop:13797 length:273 start_codon:yes stop_codon:yes gene_type:complete
MTKPNHYKEIIQVLERLHKAYPTYNVGRHISTAVDASDLWGVSDKELLLSLKKYETELNMDIAHSNEDIDNIIRDGMDLRELLFDEEDEY